MKIKSVTLLLIIISFTCCGGPQPYNKNAVIKGTIQKGPFISGTTVYIQELDDSLNPTGKSYQTTTADDFGAFSLSTLFTSRYIEVYSSGFYYNEVAGVLSSAQITLRTISDLETGETINVNLLTTLEIARLKYLINNGGKGFSDARIQAEAEILKIFHIYDSISTFDKLDISKFNDGNAILLAISVILQFTNTEAKLSENISKIGLDVSGDGVLNDIGISNMIRLNSMNIIPIQVKNNLSNRYNNLGLAVNIPNFEDYIDSDGDGIINKVKTPMKWLCMLDNSHSGFNSRGYFSLLQFMGYTYIICGENGGKEVLRSVDFTNWEKIYTNLPGMAKQMSIAFNGKVYIYGGQETYLECPPEFTNGYYENYNFITLSNIYSTSDFIDWQTNIAPWSRSMGHLVSFNNSLWLLGGYVNITGSGKITNDVWISSDGIDWNLVTAKAPWNGRIEHTAIVWKNNIWIMGGKDYAGNYNNDVWYSPNGTNWYQASASAPWSERCEIGSFIQEEKLYIIGGYDGVNEMNEIWSTENGTNWNLVVLYPEWGNRVSFEILTVSNRVYLIGGEAEYGQASGVIGWYKDIWYSEFN